MNNKRIVGLSWAAVTALVSGIAVFANGLVVAGIDPVVHTTIKNGFVGIAVLAILFAKKGFRELKKINRKEAGRLALISIVGGSVPFLLFFSGLKLIGGPQGAMIHKTLIFWVAMMAVPFLKEKMSLKMMVGIILLYGSNLLVGFSGFGKFQLGHLMVLGATILWAAENVLAKKALRRTSVELVTAARMSLGSIWLWGFALATGKVSEVLALSSKQWFLLAGVGILLLLYVLSWYRALKLAAATQVASVLIGASVITNVLQAVFVDQALALPQLGKTAMILTGIYLVVMAAWDGRGKLKFDESIITSA